jgi:hypothetical protein
MRACWHADEYNDARSRKRAVMKTHLRLRLEILVPMLGLLAMALGGCGESAAVRAANTTESFFTAQQYRKQALYASEHGDNGAAVQYLQMAQMIAPVGRQALPPPRATLLLPQHLAIAPAGGQVTCHNIGINRFACF